MAESWEPIVFPEHALLILKERLREQQAQGVRMPEGMPLDELGVEGVLITAQMLDFQPPEPVR
jgi:hypothetical protein